MTEHFERVSVGGEGGEGDVSLVTTASHLAMKNHREKKSDARTGWVGGHGWRGGRHHPSNPSCLPTPSLHVFDSQMGDTVLGVKALDILSSGGGSDTMWMKSDVLRSEGCFFFSA